MMSLIVVFGLDETHSRDDRQRAYAMLAELGFSRVQQGMLLPKMTVLGKWHTHERIEKLRDIITALFIQSGLRLTHLLVAEFTECAWYGLDLDKV